MISCDFRPLMLTTKPTPHESCSLRGSYSPGPTGDPIIVPSTAFMCLDRPRWPLGGSQSGRIASALLQCNDGCRTSRQRINCVPSIGGIHPVVTLHRGLVCNGRLASQVFACRV